MSNRTEYNTVKHENGQHKGNWKKKNIYVTERERTSGKAKMEK